MGTSPDQQQQISLKTTVVNLSAGAPQLIVPRNGSRAYLKIQNTGLNPLTYREDVAPVVGGGISLAAAATLGDQGGSDIWDDVVPTNAIYAISASGTTIVVCEG